MNKRLVITISSPQKARQYFVRRGWLWLLPIFWLSVLAGVYWYQLQIQRLERQLSVSQDHLQASLLSIEQLRQAEQSLFDSYDEQYNRWRFFDSRLDSLETLAGMNEYETKPFTLPYEERLDLALQQLSLRQQMLAKIPNGIPMTYRRISSKFGAREHPISHKRHSHIGIDLRADKGVPIYATADGYVQQARDGYDKGYGNMVTLSHQMGFDTRYAHMDSIAVKYGQFVRKGDLVGYCGNSGDSTASHLHYEVRFLGKPIDPKPFMTWDLANYESIFETVGNLPWDSFQAEISRQQQHQVPLLSQQVQASMVPLNSAATFMSTAK